MSDRILSVEHMDVSYGHIRAVRDVSFYIEEQEIVALLGANGAGKSTVMRSLLGLEVPSGGTITYQGQNLKSVDVQKRVAGGMVLVPEGRGVFPRLTVEGNLEMGAYLATKEQKEERSEKVYQMFPRLLERKKQMAGTLSGGEQQMLALGRALMANPKLLLLDEPSLGLAPIIVKDILKMITRIRDMGTTILLVEQNARSALKISDRGYVLENGQIAMEGSADELASSKDVQKLYLGI